MTKFINSIIFVVFTAILAVIGLQFLSAYKTQIRNLAIDGCSQNSGYQTQFVNDQKQTITISEPQKTLYQSCLQSKGLTK